MPHITEGLLHAHLDGALGPDEQLQWAVAEAHLEVCDDCRRRLSEAAEVRAAARDLLAAAAPARPTRPAFDELAARARARRADATSGPKADRAAATWWRTPAVLGWAASLVIAAGAGWIGRQLVVEHELEAPRAMVERDATEGRAPAEQDGAIDDFRDGTMLDEAEAQPDAATAPTAPEAASRFRADEGTPPPQEPARTEAEGLQEKAQVRSDADGVGELDAEPNRMREIMPLTVGAEAPGAERCYAVSPEAGDGGEAASAGRPETLRLVPDGTASVRLGGQPMVGFWERIRGDSLRLRVTDGEEWREYVLIEADDGVRGDAVLDAVPCP